MGWGRGNTPWSPVINNPRSSIFTAHNTANHIMIDMLVFHAQDCPSRLLKGWCSPVVCPGSWLLFAGSALPVYGVASCPLSIAWPRPLPMRVSEDAVLCSYPESHAWCCCRSVCVCGEQTLTRLSPRPSGHAEVSAEAARGRRHPLLVQSRATLTVVLPGGAGKQASSGPSQRLLSSPVRAAPRLLPRWGLLSGHQPPRMDQPRAKGC